MLYTKGGVFFLDSVLAWRVRSSPQEEAGISQRKPFKPCETSGKSSVPAQPSKLSTGKLDVFIICFEGCCTLSHFSTC